MKSSVAILGTVILGIVGMTSPVCAGDLTLSGSGVVSGVPDEGAFTVGVVTVKPTISAAMEANNTISNRIYETLKQFEIGPENTQTAVFSIDENYKQVVDENRRTTTIKDGFRVSNIFNVSACELDVFGELLDAVASAGATDIRNIRFDSSAREAKTNEARQQAVADATTKAKLYTEAMGVKLGNVKKFNESHTARGGMMYAAMSMEKSPGGSSPPIAGGQLNFTATVTIVWEIDD